MIDGHEHPTPNADRIGIGRPNPVHRANALAGVILIGNAGRASAHGAITGGLRNSNHVVTRIAQCLRIPLEDRRIVRIDIGVLWIQPRDDDRLRGHKRHEHVDMVNHGALSNRRWARIQPKRLETDDAIAIEEVRINRVEVLLGVHPRNPSPGEPVHPQNFALHVHASSLAIRL